MRKKTIKTGRSFERLIARIQKSVHDRAEIGVNEKLKDIDTGRFRQIDLTIRLSDGKGVKSAFDPCIGKGVMGKGVKSAFDP